MRYKVEKMGGTFRLFRGVRSVVPARTTKYRQFLEIKEPKEVTR